MPVSSLAIAAATALPVFLEIAASTFIFVMLSVGAIRAGTCCFGPHPCDRVSVSKSLRASRPSEPDRPRAEVGRGA